MGLIQIDSVNVLVRSQELPLFARLGPHPRTLINDATNAGELFEYWVHEASHVDMEHHHLHRWRMTREHKWERWLTLNKRRPGYVEDIYRRIEAEGAVAAGDISDRVGKKGQWWDWDDAKTALEYLFWNGRLSARRRAGDFARIYDLSERVISAEVLARPTPPEPEARKQLLELAARHHGIGTFADLTDYHRQANQFCKPLVAELVEEGVLRQVQVDGWKQPAYLHRDARIPRRINAATVLSPFDPVVWNRDRAHRLFGFHYRIEIYTPAHKRKHGYYVLPFLLGDALVARVDVKADRAACALQVHAAYAEPKAPRATAAALADELAGFARWLGLERVVVGRRGDLSRALRSQLGG